MTTGRVNTRVHSALCARVCARGQKRAARAHVKVAEGALAAGEEGDVGAKAVENARQLDCNVARADDRHLARQVLQLEETVGVDGMLGA